MERIHRPGDIKLKSDGTPQGTHVTVLQENGAWISVNGIWSVAWSVEAGQVAYARVTMHASMSEIDADIRGDMVTIVHLQRDGSRTVNKTGEIAAADPDLPPVGFG